MKKIIISLALTILLGPGVGHLYLKRFLKGAVLICATLLAVLHLSWMVARTVPAAAALTADNALKYMQDFTRNHSSLMFYYDVIFAAIWAYALVDAFLISKKDLIRKDRNPDDDSNQNI